MTAAEFWNAQEFAYLVTYSFNRGPKLAALHETTMAAIEQTKQDLQQAPFRDQRRLENQLRKLQEAIRSSTYTKKLANSHNTAERIALISQNSSLATQLGSVFSSSTEEAVFFMCPPIYRDALVFCDKHDKQLSVLNICFECLYMETDSGMLVEAGPPTYEALCELLIQLGHPISNES